MLRLVLLFGALLVVSNAARLNNLTGINLSAAGFGPSALPGVEYTNYRFPSPDDVDYFYNKSFNTFRLPILWERIQWELNGDLAEYYSSRLVTTVSFITQNRSSFCIIDLHNYQAYRGETIGESDGKVTIAHFIDIWTRLFNLLNKFGDKIIWGLMNEPLGSNTPLWRDMVQQTVNHLRKLGATQVIMVPGHSYTGASSWWSSSNAAVLWNVSDPLNNVALEIHSYFDTSAGGIVDSCVSETVGIERLWFVTKWLREYNKVAFLGEFGAGRNDRCYSCISQVLDFMANNNDVWMGWAWWAGGPMWDDYMYVLSPNRTGIERPQMKYIQPYINPIMPEKYEIKQFTRAGIKRIPMYNPDFGSLLMFDPYSWGQVRATVRNTTVTYAGNKYGISYNLASPNSAVVQLARNGTRNALFDTEMYEGMELYVKFDNDNDLQNVAMYLINYTITWREVAPRIPFRNMSTPTDHPGWYKIFFPFERISVQGKYNGFNLVSTSGAFNIYIGEAYLVHNVTADLGIASDIPETTTGTSSPGTTTTTTTTTTTISITTTGNIASSAFFLFPASFLILSCLVLFMVITK